MKKLTLFAACGFIFTGFAYSQSIERSVIGSAGGFASAGTVQLSWTAGETVINTASAGSVILTQGFQQPETGTSSVKPIDLETLLKVYPNPSNGIFKVAYSSSGLSVADMVTANVYDGAGKIVYSQMRMDLSSGASELDLSNLPGGIYTLNFTGDKNVSGTFKLTIVK